MQHTGEVRSPAKKIIIILWRQACLQPVWSSDGSCVWLYCTMMFRGNDCTACVCGSVREWVSPFIRLFLCIPLSSHSSLSVLCFYHLLSGSKMHLSVSVCMSSFLYGLFLAAALHTLTNPNRKPVWLFPLLWSLLSEWLTAGCSSVLK